MDTNATMNELVDAVLAGEWEDAAYFLSELRVWRERGGSAPRDPRKGADGA